MSSVAVGTSQKFHLSLNVGDLDRSVRFLTTLLGSPPKKCHDDYAKFEPDELPLVLSLEPRRGGPSGPGSLNHLGFRVSDAAALVDIQKRLELAGIATLREEGVECCYARQTKFWVRDPDANLWEIYVLESDIEHRGQAGLEVLDRHDHEPAAAALSQSTASGANGAAPEPATCAAAKGVEAVWAHRLDEDIPAQLAADSLDEVYLQGTFNCRRYAAAQRSLLAQAWSALRPGGKLTIHVLSTDQRLDAPPTLAGLASLVTHVPHDGQLVTEVEAAGFVGLRLVVFSDRAAFSFQGVEMRETQLVAWKPGRARPAESRVVVYKGPFAQVSDEAGQVFPRGQRVVVDSATCERLRQCAGSEHFAFFDRPRDAAISLG